MYEWCYYPHINTEILQLHFLILLHQLLQFQFIKAMGKYKTCYLIAQIVLVNPSDPINESLFSESQQCVTLKFGQFIHREWIPWSSHIFVNGEASYSFRAHSA